jgi:heme oxygenase
LPEPEVGVVGLADRLRTRTHALHVQAERAGVVGELLQGRASRDAYALLLRNLLPAYQRLEEGLESHRERAALAAVAERAVYRSEAIGSDLAALCGRYWEQSLPLLPAGERYAQRVAEAAAGDGSRLLAHAYTRFLGDLNGGRILRRLLSRSLALEADALAFYAYPEIADLDAFRHAYRGALDAAGAFADADAVAEEALAAFAHNIEVSEAVQRAAGSSR